MYAETRNDKFYHKKWSNEHFDRLMRNYKREGNNKFFTTAPVNSLLKQGKYTE